MVKQVKITENEFERQVEKLATLWRSNNSIQFAQQVVDLRVIYRKAVVMRILKAVQNQLPPVKANEAFKLFEPGDRVAAIENLYAGGLSNQQLASANQEAVVADNNRMNSQRYITVQFDGDGHKVVANASQFRKVNSTAKNPDLAD